MNKTFKVKDENGIERDANIVTSIELEGNKYLVYTIDRDSENCNIFVSKITADGMGIIDITDPSEKNKIDEIVKELIKLPLE